LVGQQNETILKYFWWTSLGNPCGCGGAGVGEGEAEKEEKEEGVV